MYKRLYIALLLARLRMILLVQGTMRKLYFNFEIQNRPYIAKSGAV